LEEGSGADLAEDEEGGDFGVVGRRRALRASVAWPSKRMELS
jgi:hypothetical protein